MRNDSVPFQKIVSCSIIFQYLIHYAQNQKEIENFVYRENVNRNYIHDGRMCEM